MCYGQINGLFLPSHGYVQNGNKERTSSVHYSNYQERGVGKTFIKNANFDFLVRLFVLFMNYEALNCITILQ